MWRLEPEQMQNPHTLSEVLDMQRPLFKQMPRWDDLKQGMLHHILSVSRFLVERKDKTLVEATPTRLSDQSLMVVYRFENKDKIDG